eukprot:6735778-Prymnesium_polylepis.1
MCEGNAPDAKLQQLSCCPQAWRPSRFERMGSRPGSRPTDGRLASLREGQRAHICSKSEQESA